MFFSFQKHFLIILLFIFICFTGLVFLLNSADGSNLLEADSLELDFSNSNFIWPTPGYKTITSPYGYRKAPTSGAGVFHAGIDICVGKNSPIYASRAGTVTSINKNCANVGSYGSRCGGGYGNYVIIDHGDGTQSIYGHMLNNITVSPGQRVSRGQVLGGMGSSGSSQATHLHFGIYYGAPMRGGKPVDPLTLF